jgi:hypothetical protein
LWAKGPPGEKWAYREVPGFLKLKSRFGKKGRSDMMVDTRKTDGPYTAFFISGIGGIIEFSPVHPSTSLLYSISTKREEEHCRAIVTWSLKLGHRLCFRGVMSLVSGFYLFHLNLIDTSNNAMPYKNGAASLRFRGNYKYNAI